MFVGSNLTDNLIKDQNRLGKAKLQVTTTYLKFVQMANLSSLYIIPIKHVWHNLFGLFKMIKLTKYLYLKYFQGFEGDGYLCKLTVSCRQNPAVCDPNAECAQLPSKQRQPLRQPQQPEFGCKCREGFAGDGFTCEGNSQTPR